MGLDQGLGDVPPPELPEVPSRHVGLWFQISRPRHLVNTPPTIRVRVCNLYGWPSNSIAYLWLGLLESLRLPCPTLQLRDESLVMEEQVSTSM